MPDGNAQPPGARPARSKISPSDLSPPDWQAIRPQYEAGIRTLRDIGEQHHISASSILKHAQRHGWTRDASRRVALRAEALLIQQKAQETRGPATRALHERPESAEKALQREVESAAQQIVAVKREHRADIRRARGLVGALLAELESVLLDPSLYARVHMALGLGAEVGEGGVVALRRMVELVESLPQRAKVAKDLAEALRVVVGMEREAFGLTTADGAGRAVVVIKDYTGKGSVEAPPLVQEQDGTYSLGGADGAAPQAMGGAR